MDVIRFVDDRQLFLRKKLSLHRDITVAITVGNVQYHNASIMLPCIFLWNKAYGGIQFFGGITCGKSALMCRADTSGFNLLLILLVSWSMPELGECAFLKPCFYPVGARISLYALISLK